MSIVYVTYYVRAEDKPAAEAAVSPYLESPGEVFAIPLVAYPGDPSAEPTHYGGNARMDTESQTYAAIGSLQQQFPGSNTQTVSPWKIWNVQTHWYGWLQTNGLQVQA